MALIIHLGMISKDNWEKMRTSVISEYNVYMYEHFNAWMEKNYDAIEVTHIRDLPDARYFKIYEFNNKDKYVEFCLTWL